MGLVEDAHGSCSHCTTNNDPHHRSDLGCHAAPDLPCNDSNHHINDDQVPSEEASVATTAPATAAHDPSKNREKTPSPSSSSSAASSGASENSPNDSEAPIDPECSKEESPSATPSTTTTTPSEARSQDSTASTSSDNAATTTATNIDHQPEKTTTTTESPAPSETNEESSWVASTIMRFFSKASSLAVDETAYLIPDSIQEPIQKRYRFGDVVGSGSFGVVRKCQERKRGGRWFACKSIAKPAADDHGEDAEALRIVLKREVSNLRGVARAGGHPHLVALHEVWEDAHHLHLVTDLCAGGELYEFVTGEKDRLRRGAALGGDTAALKEFGEARAATILKDSLSALACLHDDHGIAHRDLKASNFLFRTPVGPMDLPEVCLIDFGLTSQPSQKTPHHHHHEDNASSIHTPESDQTFEFFDCKAVASHDETAPTAKTAPTQPAEQSDDDEDARPPHTVSTMTYSTEEEEEDDAAAAPREDPSARADAKIRQRYGTLTSEVGTPYYVAPEVLLEDSYDCRCDVWSIGVIAYLLLSRGELPYRGADERETIQALMRGQQDDLSFEPLSAAGCSPGALAFCQSLLRRDPAERPTAKQALGHPWLVAHGSGRPATPTAAEPAPRSHSPDPADDEPGPTHHEDHPKPSSDEARGVWGAFARLFLLRKTTASAVVA